MAGWTKASVDSGQHTYAEAVALMAARGFTKGELDEFLRYNPGDLYRVPEAFDLDTGGVDPQSTGQVARAPIAVTSVTPPAFVAPPVTTVSSGGPSSLSLSITGMPTPSTAMPAREAAGIVNMASSYTPGSVTPLAPTAGSIPWLLILAAGVAGWFLLRKG